MKYLFFFLIATLISEQTYSQKKSINLNRDTVRTEVAKKRKADFKKHFESNFTRKETSKLVTFDVEQLKEILDSFSLKGITDIQFQFALIGVGDTAAYARNHPETIWTADARRQILNKPTLIIKIPVQAFKETSDRASLINLAITKASVASVNSAAPATSLDGNWMPAATSVYVDIGKICPPPTSCED